MMIYTKYIISASEVPNTCISYQSDIANIPDNANTRSQYYWFWYHKWLADINTNFDILNPSLSLDQLEAKENRL